MDVLFHNCPSCLRCSDFCFMDLSSQYITSPHLLHTLTPPSHWGAKPGPGDLVCPSPKDFPSMSIPTCESGSW